MYSLWANKELGNSCCKNVYLSISWFPLVVLEGTSPSGFKGFMVQAREIGGNVPIGSFHITDRNSQGLSCANISVSFQKVYFSFFCLFLLRLLVSITFPGHNILNLLVKGTPQHQYCRYLNS